MGCPGQYSLLLYTHLLPHLRGPRLPPALLPAQPDNSVHGHIPRADGRRYLAFAVQHGGCHRFHHRCLSHRQPRFQQITAPLRGADVMSAIIVDNISKKFRIPHEKKTTVFQNIIGLVKRRFDYEEFWALKNVSFEVNKGEALGIIGKNGSGKSTLLKILARVLYPDSGSVSLDGKVASFLELGIRFPPALPARET